MSLLNAISIDDMSSCGAITGLDVQALRRAFYEDGVIDAAEAETLFRLNSACPKQDPAWANCFVEMVTDYVVNQVKPEGYITAENATWLMAQIAKRGTIESKIELELLITVIDKARWSPQGLVTFALAQVKHAVIGGDGPLRAGKALQPGAINEAEVELLKRILYAFGGDGNIGITRAEAEILFDIDAATWSESNAASWPDLFVKAIANCVITASGYAPPSREQALAQEGWLQRRGDLAPGAVLGAAVHGGISSILAAYRKQSSEERAIAALERQKIEIITAEEVSVANAEWLAAHIGRSGQLTPNERALLAFLQTNSTKVAPELEKLMERLRPAA